MWETVSVGDTSYADDRKSIETFGNESKVDKVNVLSASEVVTPLNSEKEEVKSSDGIHLMMMMMYLYRN